MNLRDRYKTDPVLVRLGLTRERVLNIVGKYPTNLAALHKAEVDVVNARAAEEKED